ncbi:MAG: LolA-like putative outer membrane lipoprotein chaperone [Bacteroidota bacterium]|nr:LolA-like putative outer membrane lipoprotein chaperone [Bacteroidota bacterium]
MKRYLYFVMACWLSASASFAQNDAKALDILNKASAAYIKAGGVKAGFSLQILSKGGKLGGKMDGSIRLKGKKFKLEVEEMITWFDGNNQWVYLKKNQEVNVSNPTEKELLMINPVNVFQLYKHGYKCKFTGQESDNGKVLLNVLLTPTDKYSQLSGIVATFDKTSLRPVRIIITNKDKSGSRISIPTYLTGQNYPDTLFIFQQKNYPSTEVIDLR